MSKGLFDTIKNGQFGPEQPMTRAMLATALYRLAGAPAVSDSGVFSDVLTDAPYAAAVTWAYSAGVVTGTSATTFAPNGNITREQLAVMLYRFAKWAKMEVSASGELSAFTDAGSVSSWAMDATKWAVGFQLLSGMGDGTLAPQGAATRAQVAQILTRFERIAAS